VSNNAWPRDPNVDQQTGTHGAWNVMRRKFVSPAACSYWTVVSFAPQNFPLADVERSVMRLKQCCENLGKHIDSSLVIVV
jgi:hypothetical protein